MKLTAKFSGSRGVTLRVGKRMTLTADNTTGTNVTVGASHRTINASYFNAIIKGGRRRWITTKFRIANVVYRHLHES